MFMSGWCYYLAGNHLLVFDGENSEGMAVTEMGAKLIV